MQLATEELRLIEAETIMVGIDPDLPAITLEVVDPEGHGFRCLLERDEALEVVLKLIGSMHRLQRSGLSALHS